MTTKKKSKTSPESIVSEIKRRTRRKFTSEEKIRVVLEDLRSEESITDLCRKEDIHPAMYYKWSKTSILEWSECQINGEIIRKTSSKEVMEIREENNELKMLVGGLSIRT